MSPTSGIAVSYADGVLTLTGEMTAATAGAAERAWTRTALGPVRVVDGSAVSSLDTAGAVLVRKMAGEQGRLEGFSAEAARLLELLPAPPTPEDRSRSGQRDGSGGAAGRLERVGDGFLRLMDLLREIAILAIDVVWWSVVGLFDRTQYRKGSFTDQVFLMGSSAFPIVATIMFLIGAISVLQSASTLRTFGVSVFAVDMLVIGLSRELAPLMTAIIVSGRSGSAIASEIASMKFTEEIDALRTMGLNPVRFVVVPKLWAMVVGLPLLNVMALAFGILGGFLVAGTYMGLPPATMFNRLLGSLLAWDIVTGLIKSVSFAVIITVVGAYRGMNFSGGADGVGRATTASVVTSIFSIIVVDSIWGIIFYL